MARKPGKDKRNASTGQHFSRKKGPVPATTQDNKTTGHWKEKEKVVCIFVENIPL